MAKGRATIDELAANPQLAAELPAETIPALMGELAARQAALSAVGSALVARWMEVAAREQKPQAGDTLLTVRQAAARLNMSESWLYQNAWRFPFVVRQGAALRISQRGLERYLENLQAEQRQKISGQG